MVRRLPMFFKGGVVWVDLREDDGLFIGECKELGLQVEASFESVAIKKMRGLLEFHELGYDERGGDERV